MLLNSETQLLKMKALTIKSIILITVIFIAGPVHAQFWGGFGPGWGFFPQQDLSLGTVSLSSDTNYDGFIDSGATANLKRNPPGLVVGRHELARIDLSVIHNSTLQSQNGSSDLKFQYYKTAVTLDLRPVNLAHKRGRFKSFEEEQSRCGRVLVWLDPNRKNLLLDSADPGKRRVEWPASTSLPPQNVYVEGLAVGDSGTVMMLTLLLDNNNMGPVADKLFGDKAAWDAMMLSVWPSAKPKPYIDKSPVWKQF